MYKYTLFLFSILLCTTSCKKENKNELTPLIDYSTTEDNKNNLIYITDLKIPLYKEGVTKLEDYLDFLPTPVNFPDSKLLQREDVYNHELIDNYPNFWDDNILAELSSDKGANTPALKDTLQNTIIYGTNLMTHINPRSLISLYPFNKWSKEIINEDSTSIVSVHALSGNYNKVLKSPQGKNYRSSIHLIKYWHTNRINTNWYTLFTRNKDLFYTFFDRTMYKNYQKDMESLLYAYEDLIGNPIAVSKLKYALLKEEYTTHFKSPPLEYYYPIQVDTTTYTIQDVNTAHYIYVRTPQQTISDNMVLSDFITTRFNNEYEILWFYSFWIRRAIEGNSSQYYKILLDIRNHYNSID